MPVFRPSEHEKMNVRVQDYILKTHVDYLDEHAKNEMKNSSHHEQSTLSSASAEVELAEAILTSETTTSSSSRTKYARSSKPQAPGALKEKDGPSVQVPTSSSSSSSKDKNMNKARHRYRGFVLNSLSLNFIDAKDPEYRRMLVDCLRYPSFFNEFQATDLLYRCPPAHSKFDPAPHVQLVLGQKSSVVGMHQESLNSHSILLLLSGTKRWFFHFPESHGKYI
jgi:hypothetical protein